MPVEPRWRVPVGITLILIWIAAWSVATVSAITLIAGAHILLQMACYAVAGIAWILPLKPLIRWMNTGKWRGSSDA